MHRKIRSFIAAAAVTAAAVTGGIATAAPAAAVPRERPIQTSSLYGNNIGTFGDHDFCRGSLNVSLTSPKRGVTRVTLTSFGFAGNGPGWIKNPRCKVLMGTYLSNGLFPLSEVFYPATFEAKRGEKFTRDIVTGSGFRQLSVVTYAANSRVRLPQSYGTTLYYIAP